MTGALDSIVRLEAVDVATGRSETLLQTNLPLQSPSWSPCGRYLIANAAGRLYRIMLDREKRVLEQIFVDLLQSSHNDQAISPDGTRLALTHKTELGRAAVYVMRMDRCSAELAVAEVPAWFHGWSPDSSTIIYACERKGRWAIGTCAAEGGRERIVIQAEEGTGHIYDAPEFSADGKWIWFNSDRCGQMALWRMRVDGTGLQQMTEPEGEDWFPHPSPDGRHVCYLSYPRGTRGHPARQPVALRVMPAEGGPSRRLRSAIGGHGSMNAPCWSPDGRRFVFSSFGLPVDAADAMPNGAYRGAWPSPTRMQGA